MDEEDSIGITSMTSARRNAVAAKNSGDHKVKKQASKSKLVVDLIFVVVFLTYWRFILFAL